MRELAIKRIKEILETVSPSAKKALIEQKWLTVDGEKGNVYELDYNLCTDDELLSIFQHVVGVKYIKALSDTLKGN